MAVPIDFRSESGSPQGVGEVAWRRVQLPQLTGDRVDPRRGRRGELASVGGAGVVGGGVEERGG
jgi:hypothetical protein